MKLPPDQLLALVVGIERYAGGETWDLPGAAKDAAQFAEWLGQRGVPPENIRVFLSRLDETENLPLPPGVPSRQATADNIYEALKKDLVKAPAPFLCVFWGGHGMVKSEGARQLFCEDAHEDDLVALDLVKLLNFVRSEAVGGANPNVLKQTIVIVDACANFAELKGVAGNITDRGFPKKQVVPERDHFLLLAARPGEYAKHLSQQQTGLFSRELLARLKSEPALDCLLEPEKIYTDLAARFKALADAGETQQTPAYTSAQGLKSAFNREQGSPELAALDKASPTYSFTRSQLAELCKVTAKTHPTVPDAATEAAFRRVEPLLAGPPDFVQGMERFRWSVFELGARPPETLLIFLELCRPHFKGPGVAQAVKNWEAKAAAELGCDLAAIRAQAKKLPEVQLGPAGKGQGQTVQIIVEPVHGFHAGQDMYQLHVAVPSEPADAEPIFFKQAPELAPARQRLGELFTPLFAEAFLKVTSKEGFRVEAALPRELLPVGIEDWLVPRGGKSVPLGQRYEVNLRSYEREYMKDYHDPRLTQKVKWQKLAQGLADKHVAWIETAASADPGSFTQWEAEDTLVFCALDLEAPVDPATLLDIMESLISAGIPLALWLRSCQMPAAAAREKMKELFVARPPAEWPGQALKLRQKLGKDSPVSCGGVALLWDDPERPLPALPSRLQTP